MALRKEGGSFLLGKRNKKDKTKEISSFDLGERESKHGEERRKEEDEEEEEEEEDHRYGNYGCMDTWFRTLYLVYSLGLGNS